ncbi:virulence protein [Mycoplasma zalophi]|uniref:virulence protein n=1 Tax=Mycoplasma zalophi TaxID=191287 RepID=UPI0021C5C4CC|nr:virulence protein [Mycoplasma zalophi]MCU4116893.1 virulence protein [Mycoplasma zalophi]
MYGIVFYLKKDLLKETYGNDDYHAAYEEIRAILRHYGFHWLSNSFYYSRNINNLANIYKVIRILKTKEWFKKSLVSFNVFKMQDMSDFTQLIKDDWTPSNPLMS